MPLNTTEELIEEIREGRMVILMDDEGRENEGDFIMAAEKVRPEDINFMARYGRGLICLPLTREHCRRLNLPLMARNLSSNLATNFTVSIEAAEGVTTGISAADRATTIRKAVAPDARPSDLVQPGHIFPLMAHPGGVLSRAGHTEAGCDLAGLAGLDPSAVIVEILNEDGTMARRSDLEALARQHGLKVGTIADLIRYRTHHERTVERVAVTDVKSEYGKFRLFAYRDSIKNDIHLAMVKGEISADEPVHVRVHLENPVYDLTGIPQKLSRWPLKKVYDRIASVDNAVVVILNNQLEPEALIDQVESLNGGASQKIKKPNHDSKDQWRIGLGSQILYDLGVRKMIVLSSPKILHAISGFDLEVVKYADEE